MTTSTSTEILPGLHHWAAQHPDIGSLVSSYLLTGPGVVLNPLRPEGEPDPLDGVDVTAVVLTNRHHVRDSEWAAADHDATVHVPAAGIDDVRASDADVAVAGFVDGDELPGGLRAIEVGAISPDEFAVLLPEQRALAVADGVIREDDGPLTMVPDSLLGDDPAGVKRGLGERFAAICEAEDFDHLLLAHGRPLLEDGRDQLALFAAKLREG